MTDEEINIKIAEACGWTNCIKPSQDEYHFLSTMELGLAMGRPVGRNLSIYSDGLHYGIPNYCNDLNAMHEAERALLAGDATQIIRAASRYIKELRNVLQCLDTALFKVAHATARQRAEAFLRTLNLWTE